MWPFAYYTVGVSSVAVDPHHTYQLVRKIWIASIATPMYWFPVNSSLLIHDCIIS